MVFGGDTSAVRHMSLRMHPLALAESGCVWVGAGPAEKARFARDLDV
jgi:hypothetical protein